MIEGTVAGLTLPGLHRMAEQCGWLDYRLS